MMQFEEYKERRFFPQESAFEYSFDISLSNTTGSVEVGFRDSSNNKLVYFTFQNGQARDQNNKVIYGYFVNQTLNFRGKLDPAEPRHNYFINDDLISLEGEVEAGFAAEFYVDPTDVVVNLELDINGSMPDFNIGDAVFVEDSLNGTITLTNNTSHDLSLFNAESLNSDYIIDAFPENIPANDSQTIQVTKNFTPETETQLTSHVVPFDVVLKGSFGKIEKTIDADTQYVTKGFLNIQGVAEQLDDGQLFVATVETTSKNGELISPKKLPLSIQLESVSGIDFFDEWTVWIRRPGGVFKKFTDMGWKDDTDTFYLSKALVFEESEVFLLRIQYQDTYEGFHSVKLTVTAGEGESVGDSLEFNIEGGENVS